MQSLIVLLLCASGACAAVLRVPAEYATIQAGLDACGIGDTVLVALGTYSEMLFTPADDFALIGEIEGDVLPVIDPSSLSNPTFRRCMTISNRDTPLIANLAFRNGPEMYPRSQEGMTGGIDNACAGTELRDCRFDSVYVAVKTSTPIVLAECEFVDCQYQCVDASQNALSALRCSFAGNSEGWGLIEAGSNSTLVSCLITDVGVGPTISMSMADNGQIRQCIFYDFRRQTNGCVFVSGNGILIEGCTFHFCEFTTSLVGLQPGCGAQSIVRGCEFKDSYTPEDWDFFQGSCLAVTFPDVLPPDCTPPIIEDCIFRDCQEQNGLLAVFLGGPTIFRHNRVSRMAGVEAAAIQILDGTVTIEDCFISENGFAVATSQIAAAHAERNWWGHITGPSHPQLNPGGQGDRVGDSVDFSPWYSDTLFFSATPEPHPPLPQSAQLLVYPNPFNSSATIELTVPRAIIAKVELFDITGRRVRELFHGPTYETKQLTLAAAALPSGIYFARAWDTLGNRPLVAAKVVLLK